MGKIKNNVNLFGFICWLLGGITAFSIFYSVEAQTIQPATSQQSSFGKVIYSDRDLSVKAKQKYKCIIGNPITCSLNK